MLPGLPYPGLGDLPKDGGSPFLLPLPVGRAYGGELIPVAEDLGWCLVKGKLHAVVDGKAACGAHGEWDAAAEDLLDCPPAGSMCRRCRPQLKGLPLPPQE